MENSKPYKIPKQTVWIAYKKVKANKGSAGADGMDLEKYEENPQKNLYKLWNRMSSGSYFPKAVKAVEIPKKDGGARRLGVPTIDDRIAQMTAKLLVEPILEPLFHEDSYGYRPNKSAIEAVGMARQRCWKYDYVIDLDIKGLFDNIDHELLMKAVRKHVKEQWILLYIERWLKAPFQTETGEIIPRTAGTPQGGVISPILANLFMHYAFDVYLFCVDGLNGFREAIGAVYPQAAIQRCIIHQIRASMRYVNYKDMKQFASDLKAIYNSVTEEAALDNLLEFKAKWGKKYPAAIKSWENNWDILSTFYVYPPEIRRIIYTTNIIEGLHRQFRKVTKTKAAFPSDDSLRKMLYLASNNIIKKWTQRYRNWDLVLNHLSILFEDRQVS